MKEGLFLSVMYIFRQSNEVTSRIKAYSGLAWRGTTSLGWEEFRVLCVQL
jgi:hypothetical protein